MASKKVKRNNLRIGDVTKLTIRKLRKKKKKKRNAFSREKRSVLLR